MAGVFALVREAAAVAAKATFVAWPHVRHLTDGRARTCARFVRYAGHFLNFFAPGSTQRCRCLGALARRMVKRSTRLIASVSSARISSRAPGRSRALRRELTRLSLPAFLTLIRFPSSSKALGQPGPLQLSSTVIP